MPLSVHILKFATTPSLSKFLLNLRDTILIFHFCSFSLGMNENLPLLLLLFEFTFGLADSNMLLFPILRADWIPTCLDNHTLKCIDSFAHLLVQLLLHWMQMERNVLAETGDEGQRLLDGFRWGHMRLLHFYIRQKVSLVSSLDICAIM